MPKAIAKAAIKDPREIAILNLRLDIPTHTKLRTLAQIASADPKRKKTTQRVTMSMLAAEMVKAGVAQAAK